MNKPKPLKHLLSRLNQNMVGRVMWDVHGDKSGPFSMFDMCYDVAELLSDKEWEHYLRLPKQQKDELREHAHDVTVNAIFKMMNGATL